MSTNTDLEALRRPQIIQAALLVISQLGIANVTMDDIARSAGLSKGGVAHYFSGKDALCKEAFREFFARIFQRSRDTMDACDGPLEKLLSFGWLYNWEDPDVNLGYPLLFDCMALASRDAEYRRLFHDWVDSWIAMLRESVMEGLRLGMFAGIEPDGAARTISSIYHGVAVRWYLDRDSHTSAWAVDACKRSIAGLLGVNVRP
ncbi:MAG: TetR/AcrR family transcriptional regulator [Spirochaetes bacterium]|jgi:AcrR family transcriptional regulator|nr:TetR/AcrR family transcriptional regulator [Spirochaetota bacterium]